MTDAWRSKHCRDKDSGLGAKPGRDQQLYATRETSRSFGLDFEIRTACCGFTVNLT